MVKKSLLTILFLVSGFVLLGATNNTQKMQSRDFPSVSRYELKQPGALLITYSASWNTDDVTAKAGTLIANSTISVMSDSGSTIATLRIDPHGSTNPNTNPSGSFLPADYTSPPYKHGAAYANVVGVWEVNGLSPGTYLVAHRNQSRWVDGLEGTLCEMSTSVDVKTRETPTPPPPSSYSLRIIFPRGGAGTVAIEGESLSSPNGKTFSFSPGKSITMMATVREQSDWGGYSGSHSSNDQSIAFVMDGDKMIEVNFIPKVLVNVAPTIAWTIAPSNVAHGQGYTMVAQARDERAITDLTITKNGVAVGSYLKRELWGKTGDVSTESTDAGPASIVWVATVKDESGASASATAVVSVGSPTPTEEPKKEPPPVGVPSGNLTINGVVNCTGRLSGNPGTYAANLAWNTSNVKESTVSITGPGVLINEESSGTQGLSYSGAGTYQYRLTATGLDGTFFTQSATLVVSPAILPPAGTLSFTFTPASLPASGGIATAVWSNDGTDQQLGGPQLNASPGSFSGVSPTGSQSYSIPANPTTSPQNYNMVFRGTRADGSSFNLYRTVTVAGASSNYMLRTEVTPTFMLGSYSQTAGLMFHTNHTFSNPSNYWTFTSPQTLMIVLAGKNYPKPGIYSEYELESITVEPASALDRYADERLNPSSSAYNPRAFGESVANISGTPAVMVRLSPSTPSVTVIARCVKKSAMDVQVSVTPEPNRCTIEPLYAVTAEAKVETNLSGLAYQWVLIDGSGRETAPSSGGSTARAGFADILPGNYQAKVTVRSSSGAMAVKIVDFNLAPNDLKWPKVELSMDKAKLRPGEPAKLKYIIRSP